MKISVVIPSHNEEKFIGKTLRSLADQAYPAYEVIVVDNASSDKTAEVSKKAGAIVLREPQKGVSFARQAGFLKATGEIIVSTDADATFSKNWLLRIENEFAKDPKLVGLSGPIWPQESYWQEKVLFFLHAVSNFWQYHLGLSFFIGGNFAVLREAFLKSGGFTSTSESSEEGDLFNSIKYLGKLKFLPKLVVRVSTRRVRKVGITRMIWWSFCAWLSFNIFKKMARPSLPIIRTESERKREEFVDQAFCFLLVLGAFIIFSFAYGIILPLLILICGRFVFAQRPKAVIKRLVVTSSIILVGLLPVSAFFLSQTSFAQEMGVPNLKEKITALKLQERFKDLSDVQILEKIRTENLENLLK